MYVSPELRERLPPAVIGWRSDRNWRNHENLHHGAPRFSPDAEKYEGGMLPFALLYAMDAVIEMMQAIGPERIERRVLELARNARRAAGRRRDLACGQQSLLQLAGRLRAIREPGCLGMARELHHVKFWWRRGTGICVSHRIFITTMRIWSGWERCSDPRHRQEFVPGA